MTGPCLSGGLMLWIIIFVPVGVFCFVVLPRSWTIYPTLSLASLCLFANMIALLLATSCSEPGVIPNRAVIEALGIADHLTDVLGYNLMGEGEPTRDPKVDAKGMLPYDLQGKGFVWCRTCEIIRPPRASHCRQCDNCVLRYDHHCPFLNNCIAQRNYAFFVGFLCSILFSTVFGISVTLTWSSVVEQEMYAKKMKSIGQPLDVDVADSVSSGVSNLVFYIGSVVSVLSVCVLGFLGYHLFLVYQGKTTKEFKVKATELKSRPTLWAKRGPPLFNPRALVEPQSLAEALRKSKEMRQIARAKAAEEAKRLKEEDARERKLRKERKKDEDLQLDPEEAERQERRRALRRLRMEDRRKAAECCTGERFQERIIERFQEFKSRLRRLHYSFMKGSFPPRVCCRRLDKAKVHIDV